MIDFTAVKDQAEAEAYEYFHNNIRALPLDSNGNIDTSDRVIFQNSDVDAFRHAYVSGVMSMEYNQSFANVLGWVNEIFLEILDDSDEQAKAMDLHNRVYAN